MADLRAQLAWCHAFRSQVRLQGELDALRSKMVGSLRLIAGDTVVLTESLCCLQVIMAVAPQRQRGGTPRFIVDMAFLHCNPPSSAQGCADGERLEPQRAADFEKGIRTESGSECDPPRARFTFRRRETRLPERKPETDRRSNAPSVNAYRCAQRPAIRLDPQR